MSFNSLNFLLFFFMAFVVVHYFAHNQRVKLSLILLFNLIFYATWSPGFVLVMLGMGLIDFQIAKKIYSLNKKQTRAKSKLLIFLSVVMNIGMIVLSRHVGPQFNFAVPLGISFFTFQSLSYIIDVHRGQHVVRESRLEFLASLTFFPHLLAGPIIRSSFLIPQFVEVKSERVISESDLKKGAVLFASGLLKKSLADRIAPVVESAFRAPTQLDFVDSWTGVLGFAAQIYGDIAGYSDMAAGIAVLLGYRLPINMNLPYLATTPAEFWRRWYMSLSTWFRDYLFYPSSLGWLKGHPYMNLLATMILVGLWHGFSTNYLAFGMYHGVLLVLTYWLSSNFYYRVPTALKMGLTFYLILIGQTLFRSPSISSFFDIYKSLHFLNTNVGVPQIVKGDLVAAVVILIFCHALDYALKNKPGVLEHPVSYWGFTSLSLATAMYIETRPDFVYFQF